MLEKEQSIKPKTAFQSMINYPLSNREMDILATLYQPIIGADALSLYLTLMSEINYKGVSEVLFHADLIMMMDKSTQQILTARKRLEGIGLLDTYYSYDNDLEDIYIYHLLNPESVERFFQDEVLVLTLLDSVGKRKLDKLFKKFKPSHHEFKRLKKINASFKEVYGFKEEQIISYQDKLAEISNGVQSLRPKIPLSESTTTFDWDFFSQRIMKLGIKLPENKENFKEEVFAFHNLYGITELEMIDACSNSFNYQTSQIVTKEFKRTIYQTYAPKKKQVVKQQSFNQSNQLSDKDQQSYRYNSLKMQGFSVQETETIIASEAHFPLKYLEGIKAVRNGYVTSEENYLVKSLVSKSGLPNSVINILLDYVYNIQKNPTLSAGYVNRIANEWAENNINSPEKAIVHVRETLKKLTKNQSNQRQYNKNRPIIRQEKLPDWVNKPVEEKGISIKEKEKIDKEIQDFLNKGGDK